MAAQSRLRGDCEWIGGGWIGAAGIGGDYDLRGGAAVGQGDAGGCGGAEGGGDAGDDLEGDVGAAQGFDFFSGTAEDYGVAAFQADDFVVGSRFAGWIWIRGLCG